MGHRQRRNLRTRTTHALAAQLAGQAETVCAAAERLFATGRAFDREAPHAALHLQLIRETLGSGAGDAIRLVDGMVSPPLGHFRTPGVESAPLFHDRWVCVVSADHPLCDVESFGIEDLARLPWVVHARLPDTARPAGGASVVGREPRPGSGAQLAA
ncbi:LysR substrate-binding domain-containing protein [Streptomyces mexicanus]|uniref:LysR substrate-binding domain-containing protein n=1 Tax=Streptomyces mexicanus TaxID=178566 RepID=UPI0036678FAA